ncbi:uncharacterized protein LACBIDRAFT_304237 [Laccaria bicolor S238N-H82]|uniref:Predicted protein n=1 Tax=Laccaria bicolor (strain S238N-H82 / ATCC MYA-4686) TaxID=486041 RepID=B0DK06_LACBS|nr:uncharacterized protein LACBIDRAFT_303667 [Laccaria bicolor S238N-H82]XP_001884774.1 uncharacterized protein LACBIDRAFT_304237 [Laccaria bicolor S238N-H82]EDR04602.1 predicted protein [Laccaria bicolor S238N-H82]EDR04988.1 predicted protein [Laccaria bicolor S238N-H82]|eukprot:XP_001884378.1 predicted protein [Laccaria bicolor S238N-H82]
MRPRIPKNFTPSSSPLSYTPISGKAVHYLSRPSGIRPLVLLPDERTFSQQRNLKPLPGQVGFAGDRPLNSCSSLSADGSQTADVTGDLDDPSGIMFFSSPSANIAASPVSNHRRKRENQTIRWKSEVIPRLIMPYMRLVSQTESFRLPIPEDAFATTLTCQCITRALEVIVVRFCVLERLKLQFCKCRPAAVQLLQRGLFPSAPFAPSLAVDIRVLEFVSRLFLHISPNATAWCNTVEEFLQSQGYKLTTKDSLTGGYHFYL